MMQPPLCLKIWRVVLSDVLDLPENIMLCTQEIKLIYLPHVLQFYCSAGRQTGFMSWNIFYSVQVSFFYPSTNSCHYSWGIGKLPWSFRLDLCLTFSARLRDLTDNCTCGVQRWGSHSKVMLNTIICNSLCDLLSTFLLLNLFRLAITKGLNTYWLKTFQLFIFYSFVNISKSIIPLWQCGVLCVGQWQTSKLDVTQQNV